MKDGIDIVCIFQSTVIPDLYFVREDVLKRFHLKTRGQEKGLDGMYYTVSSRDISEIMHAKQKDTHYVVKFVPAPLGKVVHTISEETAKDLVDQSMKENPFKNEDTKIK